MREGWTPAADVPMHAGGRVRCRQLRRHDSAPARRGWVLRALQEPGRCTRGPEGGVPVRVPGRAGCGSARDGRTRRVLHRGGRPGASAEPAGARRERRTARGELGRGPRARRRRGARGELLAGDGGARLDVVHGDRQGDGHDHPGVRGVRRVRIPDGRAWSAVVVAGHSPRPARSTGSCSSGRYPASVGWSSATTPQPSRTPSRRSGRTPSGSSASITSAPRP